MFNKVSLKRSSTKFNLKNKSSNKKEENEIKQRNEYMKMMDKINYNEQQQQQQQQQQQRPTTIKRSESLIKLKRTSSNIGSAIYNTIDTISTPTNKCNNLIFYRSNSSISINDCNDFNSEKNFNNKNNNKNNNQNNNNKNNKNNNNNNNNNNSKNTKDFDNAAYISKIFNFYLF